MIVKTVTYPGFSGKEITEDVYFNLTAAELLELEAHFHQHGGLQGVLQEVGGKQDPDLIMSTFKYLMLSAYGVRSRDGERFTKDKNDTAIFAASEAYSQIFMEIISDADAAADFVNGLVHNQQGYAKAENRAARRAQEATQNRPQPQDRQPKQQPRHSSVQQVESPAEVQENPQVAEPETKNVFQDFPVPAQEAVELGTDPAVLEQPGIPSSVTGEDLTDAQIAALTPAQIREYYNRK